MASWFLYVVCVSGVAGIWAIASEVNEVHKELQYSRLAEQRRRTPMMERETDG